MTLWAAAGSRWWFVTPVLYSVGGVGLTVLLAATTRLNPWSLLASLLVPYGFVAVRDARARVRLTPEGVEVRGLRTTLLPYADITSVGVSPEWDGARSVWVRLRSSAPQAEAEVLTPPPEWWHVPGHSLAEVVALIQARVDAAHGGARN